MLKGALGGEDKQLHHYAQYLLLSHYRELRVHEGNWPDALPEDYGWLENLKDDDIEGNAGGAFSQLHRILIRPHLPSAEKFHDLLSSALASDDRQVGQCAAILLCHYYEAADIPEAEWPQTIFTILVEGLKFDRLRIGTIVDKFGESYRILSGLQSCRPNELLWQRSGVRTR